MKFLSRFLPPFFLAWLLAFSLASVFHSQYVVNELVEVGVVVEFSERLKMTFDDWFGLLPTYGVIIALAYLFAFSVAGLITRFISNLRPALFALSGVAAFATVLIAIESIMNINVVAGAREHGFYMQLAAGALGGLLFGFRTKQ